MRRLPALFLVLTVLCCCLAGCASSAFDGALTLRAERQEAHGPDLQYIADYPAFPGHPRATERVAAIVDQAISEFTALARENRAARMATATAEEKTRGFPPYECLISWTCERIDADAVSLLMEVYYYTGGAHGISYLRSVNYDPRSRSLLGMGEVVGNPGEAWLETIAIRARAELQARLNPQADPGLSAMIEEGTAPLPANYECFTFTRGTLSIHFQKYQVGPGALGSQTVALPLELSSRFRYRSP